MSRRHHSLVISARDRKAIVRHAREAAPRECCGLLIGTARRVVMLWPAANAARGTARYRIAPRDHFAAIRHARGGGEVRVVGAYHSHPRGPARPSARDRRESPGRDWLHIIVGLAGQRAVVRAFVIDGEDVRAVRLRSGRDQPRGRRAGV